MSHGAAPHTGTAHVLRADARTLPLPDDTVDLVVTSPPYFALRSYTDAGEHYAGQIGDEPTPTEFVASLLEVTAECVRVLRPSGSLFVNLGDKYSTYAGNRSSGRTSLQGATDRSRPAVPRHHGLDGGGEVRAKSLMGIPWRYAIACIDDLGLILRAELIWSKPNGLPESVTDRVRRSHEQWFHFTLNPRYYSAVDEIREEHSGPWKSPGQPRTAAAVGPQARGGHSQWERTVEDRDATVRHALGKLPGSVWTVATEPLRVPEQLGVDHFAAFPTEWPKRIIAGWSPTAICTACGEGRRPVTDSETTFDKARDQAHATEIAQLGAAHGVMSGGTARSTLNGTTTRTIVGHACACTPYTDHPGDPDYQGAWDTYAAGARGFAPTGKQHILANKPPDRGPWREYHFDSWDAPQTRPAVVLDPFGGTGTTAMVAKALGRTGISVDMSGDYCRVGQWRTNDRNQLAKVLGLPKTPAPDLEQLDLFTAGGTA